MPIDARFKLQTMETGVPSLMISKNGIFLSVNLYKKLNGAKYVQVYLSEETREIAIAKCNKEDEAAVELKFADKYARIYNRDFINTIASLLLTTFYAINIRVNGRYVSDGDYYIFDLNTAKKGKVKENL